MCYAACSSTVTSSEPAFAISGVDTNVAAAAFAAATTSLTELSCGNDWLQIPCATDQMNSVYTSASVAAPTGPTVGCVNKLCGIFFSALAAATANAPVYSITIKKLLSELQGLFWVKLTNANCYCQVTLSRLLSTFTLMVASMAMRLLRLPLKALGFVLVIHFRRVLALYLKPVARKTWHSNGTQPLVFLLPLINLTTIFICI